MRIEPATKQDFPPFFVYLNNQISENGVGEFPLFMPFSIKQRKMVELIKKSFIKGYDIEFGKLGWRRFWLIKDGNNIVKGHVDLRHHRSPNCMHRVLLGMGVDSSCRNQGIGKKLLESAIQFCHENKTIDWLDLFVLSENIPAKNLYVQSGFSVVGEHKDKYRIDGQSVSETSMTKSMRCKQ